MARFESEAELETFLGSLDSDYCEFASALWQQGIKTQSRLANAIDSIFLDCGMPKAYISDIRARAGSTCDLNAGDACPVCLLVPQGILHVPCLCAQGTQLHLLT